MLKSLSSLCLLATFALNAQPPTAPAAVPPASKPPTAVAAGPVYKLLGKDPLNIDVWPAARQPVLHDLSYYMHDGDHGMVPTDWEIYIQFLKMHLHPER